MKISKYFLIVLTSLTLWACPEEPGPKPMDTGGEQPAGETAGTFMEDMMVEGGGRVEGDMEVDMSLWSRALM